MSDLLSMVSVKTTSWFLSSCAGFSLGLWIQGAVNEYSLVWFLAGFLMVASLPGVVVGAYVTFLILLIGVIYPSIAFALATALAVLLIYGLYRMAIYFIQNPI